ncbi:MAG: cupin domain-containing protein [Myxococcota bacterium]
MSFWGDPILEEQIIILDYDAGSETLRLLEANGLSPPERVDINRLPSAPIPATREAHRVLALHRTRLERCYVRCMRPLSVVPLVFCVFVLGLGLGKASQESAATVLHLDELPVKHAASGKARVQIMGRGRNAFVGRLELDAGAKVPLHRDATEEYIHVIEGSGTMTIEGKTYEVRKGTTIYMPANAEVSFENGPQTMVGLQVFAGPGPAAKYDAWK